MTSVAIAPSLRELFGERQTARDLITIAAVMPLAVAAVWPSLLDVPLWRAALAAILVADIAAGAVANLTAGTNAHYAASGRRRALFIAVHVHLPLVALLLDLPLWPAVAAWAMTIIAAVIVERSKTSQRVTAGALLVAILAITALVPGASAQLLFVAALFAFKVAYAFAVDHDRPSPSALDAARPIDVSGRRG